MEELVFLRGQRLNWDVKTNDGYSAFDLALDGGFENAVVNLLQNRSIDGISDFDMVDVASASSGT